jgi:hypothetical protein
MTMFDLEGQFEQWRRQFMRQEAMRASDIEELEQHVRDSMPVLISAGLSVEEAFIIATRRVGAPISLGREFGKVNGRHVWSRRVLWILAGSVGYVVLSGLVGAVASLSLVMVALAGGSGVTMGYTAMGITCLCWALVSASLYRRLKDPPSSPMFPRLSLRAIGMCLIGAVAAGTVISFAIEVLAARLIPVHQLGQAAMVSSWMNILPAVLIPLLLWVMVLRIEPAETGSAEP